MRERRYAPLGLIDRVVALEEALRVDEILTAGETVPVGDVNKTFYLDAAGGFTVTLPAPVLGLEYKFLVKTAPTSGDYIVGTASGDNIMYGTLIDPVGAEEYFSAQDNVHFVSGTSVIGDYLHVESDGTNWYVRAISGANGGMTYSAT